MEVPPFIKNYLLSFFGVEFVPFIVPSLIITPPYITWMCYLGSLCTDLVDADETDESEKTSIAKYVLSAAGLLATIFIFIYLMWYTKKMMRKL